MERNTLLNRKLFFADARLMMHQTERLRTERNRWESIIKVAKNALTVGAQREFKRRIDQITNIQRNTAEEILGGVLIILSVDFSRFQLVKVFL